jgi:hypothetical protein
MSQTNRKIEPNGNIERLTTRSTRSARQRADVLIRSSALLGRGRRRRRSDR